LFVIYPVPISDLYSFPTRRSSDLKGVEIAEQDQRNFGFFADILARLEILLKRHTVSQRTIRGALDNRSICNRIRKWNADFDQISAGLLQSKDEFKCHLQTWIACRKVRNEGLPVSGFQLPESFFDPG